MQEALLGHHLAPTHFNLVLGMTASLETLLHAQDLAAKNSSLLAMSLAAEPHNPLSLNQAERVICNTC